MHSASSLAFLTPVLLTGFIPTEKSFQYSPLHSTEEVVQTSLCLFCSSHIALTVFSYSLKSPKPAAEGALKGKRERKQKRPQTAVRLSCDGCQSHQEETGCPQDQPSPFSLCLIKIVTNSDENSNVLCLPAWVLSVFGHLVGPKQTKCKG